MNARKKLVVVVLVLMMMVTAVAYAAWSDTIQVNGSVTTGKFDVEWSASASSGSENENDGSVSVSRNSQDTDVLNVNIENAKPGDVYTITAVAENVGTLAAEYKGLAITDDPKEPSSNKWKKAGNNVPDEKFKLNNVDAYTVKTNTNAEKTLERPGDQADSTQTFTFTVTIDEDISDTLEDTNGNFYIHFNYEQEQH